MKLLLVLTQADIDRLNEAGLITENVHSRFSHKDKQGVSFYNLFFDIREEWDAAFDFLHPENEEE